MESAAVTSANRLVTWGALAVLLAALILEALFYPQVATRLYRLFSRRSGWDGTALAFVQSQLVVPVAIGLASALLVLATWMRRQRRSMELLVLVGWAAHLALLALSIAWYARLADRG